MTIKEAKKLAKEMLAQEGMKPVDIVASALIAQAQAEQKYQDVLQVHKVEPIRSTEEKQEVLKAAVMNAIQPLYAAFHTCGIPQEINTVIQSPDGPFTLIFKRKLDILRN